jgi:hypothetical protein
MVAWLYATVTVACEVVLKRLREVLEDMRID